jgi:hypothetical protein
MASGCVYRRCHCKHSPRGTQNQKLFPSPQWYTLDFHNSSPELAALCQLLCISNRSSGEPHGATRKQAIAKAPATWSAYQIPTVTVVFIVLVFKVQFFSLIHESHKRPRIYYLQGSATEHSSTWHCIRFYTICWIYWNRLQMEWDYRKKKLLRSSAGECTAHLHRNVRVHNLASTSFVALPDAFRRTPWQESNE